MNNNKHWRKGIKGNIGNQNNQEIIKIKNLQTKELIIKKFQEKVDNIGIFYRKQWNNLMDCNAATVRNHFGLMDELSKQANRKFKKYIMLKKTKEKQSKSMKGKNVGTYEEKYGKEQAIIEKQKRSIKQKGIKLGTLEERYGKEKAITMKEKISLRNSIPKDKIIKEFQRKFDEVGGFCKNDWNKLMFCNSGTIKNKFGSMDKFVKIANREFKKYIFTNEWYLERGKKRKGVKYSEKAIKNFKNSGIKRVKKNKKIIINEYKQYCKLYGSFCKGQWDKIMSFNSQTIRNNFGSLDVLAEEVGVPFKEIDTVVFGHHGRIGKNETVVLNEIEREKRIKLKRQYFVKVEGGHYYINGYDIINNIAYENDEYTHKFQNVQDIIRENKIKEILDCKFIRLDDREQMRKIENENIKTLEDF